MKKQLSIFLLFFFVLSSGQSLYGSSQKIREYGDEYQFSYEFKDHKNAIQEFDWHFNKWKINNYILGFGLPDRGGEGDKVTFRRSELQSSNLYINGGNLYFKYDRIITNSRDIVRPLYQNFKMYIRAKKLNRREQIELVMRFLQDIPYYIPPKSYQNRYIGGLFPPSEVLKNGKGDCDSKSVLMAAILSHDPFYYDKLAMIHVPGHALLGIEAPPMAYDQYIEHGGRTFVYAEPVGPRRTPFGKANSPYSQGIEVFPLKLFPPSSTYDSAPNSDLTNTNNGSSSNTSDSSGNSSAGGGGNVISDCPDGGLLIEYKRPFAAEMVKSCQINVEGSYIKHGPTQVVSSDSGKVISTEYYKKGSKL